MFWFEMVAFWANLIVGGGMAEHNSDVKRRGDFVKNKTRGRIWTVVHGV